MRVRRPAAPAALRRRLLLPAALALLASSWPAPSVAGRARLRLRHADASECAAKGLLHLHAVELELEGVLRSRPPSDYRLVQGKRTVVARRPVRARPFSQLGWPIYLALVIEQGPAYERDMAAIRAGAITLLESLPPRSRVNLLAYSWRVDQLVARGTPRQAIDAIELLQSNQEAVELTLVEALQTALRSVARAPAQSQRAVVAISDGINRLPDWDLFRGLGTRARKAGIPIHFVGYSPADERGPLLNLGEVSKRSLGTFRWARQAALLGEELGNVARELLGQMVLTYEIADRCARGRDLALVSGTLRSNALRVPRQRQPAAGYSTSHARWLLLGGVLLVGVAAIFLVTRWLLRRPPDAST